MSTFAKTLHFAIWAKLILKLVGQDPFSIHDRVDYFRRKSPRIPVKFYSISNRFYSKYSRLQNGDHFYQAWISNLFYIFEDYGIDLVLDIFLQWSSHQIRKIACCACTGKSGNDFPPPASKETASERYRHASRHVRHARVMMYVMISNAGKTFPAFPAHTQPPILRIW